MKVPYSSYKVVFIQVLRNNLFGSALYITITSNNACIIQQAVNITEPAVL